MKKLIPLSLACLLLLSVSNLQAQTAEDPWGFTIRTGFSSYNGDLGNSMLELTNEGETGGTNVMYGVGMSYYLSDGFDIALALSLMSLEKSNPFTDNVFKQRGTFFETNIVNLNLLLRWKFLNTFVDGRDVSLNPYFAAGLGAGFMHFGQAGRKAGCCVFINGQRSRVGGNPVTARDPDEFIFSIPFGGGINYEITDGILFNLQLIYNRSFSDEVDQFPIPASEQKDDFREGSPSIDDIDHDDWLTTTVGLTFAFGGDEEDELTMEERLLRQSLEQMENIEEAVDEVEGQLDQLIGLNEESLNALDQLQEDLNMSERQMEEMRGKFVRIINNIQFAFDESYIIEPAYDELESLVGVMQSYENLNIHLEAYADRRGSVEYNEDLASRRAQSVKDFLTERGIDPSRITTEVYGETKAVYEYPADADKPTVWAQNRAVQITLSYDADNMDTMDNDNMDMEGMSMK